MTDKFEFPLSVDLTDTLEPFPAGAVMSGADAPAAAADPLAEMGGRVGGPHRLVAILAHKGSNATSGHYGASFCFVVSHHFFLNALSSLYLSRLLPPCAASESLSTHHLWWF